MPAGQGDEQPERRPEDPFGEAGDDSLEGEASIVVDPSKLYRLEFDGAARGNAKAVGRRSGCGAVLLEDSTNIEVGRTCVRLGSITNNAAEYKAVIYGLEAAKRIGVRRIKVQGDSNLVVQQVNGVWRVKEPSLMPLHRAVMEVKSHFDQFVIRHVYREHNKTADAIANHSLDVGGWAGLRAVQETDCTPGGAGGGRPASQTEGRMTILDWSAGRPMEGLKANQEDDASGQRKGRLAAQAAARAPTKQRRHQLSSSVMTMMYPA
ncbi:hypothetical protein WJX72_011625 [[Myrmecia] bisecta]|uniref:RNase H type-1 domain-containing protein n=1 Tax=[Myrmecia] bisecta TaxID=41462 RepID=A0AAW1Q1U7_9CHLO